MQPGIEPAVISAKMQPFEQFFMGSLLPFF